jgi:DNA polymerase-3 subunit beta
MEFKVSSGELLKHLNVVAGAIHPNPVLAITEDFLVDISKGTMTITATNLETSISTRMEVESKANGSVAIPAKILLETLKALPNQEVSFDADIDQRSLVLTTETGMYKMAVDPPDDFPSLPTSDGEEITLPVERLMSGISSTIFATTSDEMRPAMTGVNVVVDFNKISFVASDGHKLVRYHALGTSTEQTGSFVVPKKALALLKGATPSEGNVYLKYNKSHAFFRFEETEVICRLINQAYPDFNAVIPVNNENTLHVSRTHLLGALRRINIFANRTTNQVFFGLADNSLTITTKDLDFSNEASEQLSCEYEGEPMDIAFNARFFIELLNALHQEEIHMTLSVPSKPVLIYPDEQFDNEEVMMLIMPVIIY